MPQPPKDKPVWETTPLDVFDMIYSVCVIYAGVVLPVIHGGFGTKALAPYVFTAVLLWAFAMGFPPAFPYVFAWLAFVAYRRVTVNKLAHTNYRGYPWLACLIPFVSDEFKGRIVEPWIVFAFGVHLKTYADAPALFVIGAAVALVIVLLVERATIAARIRAVADAEHDAAQWAAIRRGEDGWGRRRT
jgi:hypothetical protein